MKTIQECPNWRDLTPDNIYQLRYTNTSDIIHGNYTGGCIVECDKRGRKNICCLECSYYPVCPDDHKRKCTRKIEK